MASTLKVAAFTVRGSTEQAARWNRAAQADGHRSAGTWLAAAADAYLKVRAKAGLPIPLAWIRSGRFAVRLEGGELVTVNGRLSPPFGVYVGTASEPSTYASRHRYTLVFVPEARIIATLRTYRQCQALASELAPTLLRSEPFPDPAAITARAVRDAK